MMSKKFSEWAGSVPTLRGEFFLDLLLTVPASRAASVLASRTAVLTSLRV